MCEACEVMAKSNDKIDEERKRIVDAIRQMQKEQHSNFISGNDLIDIIYKQNVTKPAEPKIWDIEYECW